jgi:uncharacterized membrane-anchored protein
MKNNIFWGFLILALSTSLSSCELVGDILSIGFYAGIIVVVVIIAIIVWIYSKFRRRR